MFTLMSVFAAHSAEDWELENLLEGLDQQEAFVSVLEQKAFTNADGEEGTRLVLEVEYEEDYQLENVNEEIDQSPASAHVMEEFEDVDAEEIPAIVSQL